MSSIEITPVETTYTITSLFIQNIFIDIQNDTITIEVNKVDENQHIVDRLTLIASGEDYTNIYDEDALKDFVLTQLGLQVPEN